MWLWYTTGNAKESRKDEHLQAMFCEIFVKLQNSTFQYMLLLLLLRCYLCIAQLLQPGDTLLSVYSSTSQNGFLISRAIFLSLKKNSPNSNM
jgi:hypothetical protein